MRERNEVSDIRERFTDEQAAVTGEALPLEWRRALGTFTVLFIAAVVAGVVLSGCGQRSESSAQASSASQSMEPAGGGTQAQVASTVAVPASASGGLSAGDRAELEGLPPDLAVSVADTLVSPGEAIEFTVEGTDDVSMVALEDGRDDPLPFVHDEGTNLWRATYRVPLHPKSERFAVSVTARTDAERWRRVWVFLHVERGNVEGERDSIPADNPDEMGDER